MYQALGRLFKRGLITKRPSATEKRNKVYGISNPYDYAPTESCDNKPEIESIKIEGSPPLYLIKCQLESLKSLK